MRVAEARAGSRYSVLADISLFYQSVYTHSIPWMFHGKSIAKANRSPSLVGNVMDSAIRLGQDQQTIGIPIGPDTSFILTEAILGRVDETLQAELGSGLRGFRRIDDYEICCASETEAEHALALLRSTLAEYELQLNSRKTAIVETRLSPRLSPWSNRLKAFGFRNSPAGQHDDLLSYFELADELRRQFPTSSVLRFAAGPLEFIELCGENWPMLQYLLLQAVISEPDCLRRAMRTLVIHSRRQDLPIDRERVKPVLETLITRQALMGSSSEVAWALWSALVFDIPLAAEVGRVVSQMDDSAVALVALDARERGIITGINTSLWQQLIGVSELRREHWLLAYEAPLHTWLGSVADIGAVPEFKWLMDQGVRFYDSSFWLDQLPPVQGTPPLVPRPTPPPSEPGVDEFLAAIAAAADEELDPYAF